MLENTSENSYIFELFTGSNNEFQISFYEFFTNQSKFFCLFDAAYVSSKVKKIWMDKKFVKQNLKFVVIPCEQLISQYKKGENADIKVHNTKVSTWSAMKI